MTQDTCCLCFSLKTGVWLIGLFEMLCLVQSLVEGFLGGQLPYPGSTYMLAVIPLMFIVLFLFMMLDKENFGEKERRYTSYFYLIGMVIVPFVIGTLGMYGPGFDFVTPICHETQKHKATKIPLTYSFENCAEEVSAEQFTSLAIFTLMKLYFAHILHLWAKKATASGYKPVE